MKYHFWQFLSNTDGTPIENAYIHVFKSDQISKSEIENSSILNGVLVDPSSPNDYAYIGTSYSTIVSNYSTSDSTFVQPNSKGFFEFWVSDKGEEGTLAKGYDYEQLFTIAIVKSGFSTLVIENINIFPINYPYDVNDNASSFSNKSVNNNIMYDLTEHSNYTYENTPHGISTYDPTSTSSDPDWEVYNKLLSNKLIKSIENNTSNLTTYDSNFNYLSGSINDNTNNISNNVSNVTWLSGQIDNLSLNFETTDLTLQNDINWLSGVLINYETSWGVLSGDYNTINQNLTDLTLSFNTHVLNTNDTFDELIKDDHFMSGKISELRFDFDNRSDIPDILITRVNINSNNIDDINTDLTDIIDDINILSGNFLSQRNDISWLSGQIDDISSNIIIDISNDPTINWLSGQIDDNTNLIENNTIDIGWLSGQIDDIRTISGVEFCASLSADIHELQSNVSWISGQIDDNTNLIENNTVDIGWLSGQINDNDIVELIFDNSLSINNTYSGIVTNEYVRETVLPYNALYYSKILSGYMIAQSNALSSMLCDAVALESKNENEICKILHWGFLRNDSWDWSLNDKILYVDNNYAGDFTSVPPTGSNNITQAIGLIRTPNIIKFDPSLIYFEY